MKFSFWTLVIFLSVSCAKQLLPVRKSSINYEVMWQNITELEKQGLSKSALNQVYEIFNQALQESNNYQTVKSSIFIAKYTNELDEKGLQSSIAKLETILPNTKSYATSIIHSILGELYEVYFYQNIGNLHERMVGPADLSDDINTWSGIKLIDTARAHYFKSIEDPATTDIKINTLSDLIIWDKHAEIYDPSLRFLLLDRAIGFLKKEHNLPFQEPENYFTQSSAFYPEEKFVNEKYPIQGDLYQILNLFQERTRELLENNDLPLRIKNELNRLNFVFSQSIHPKRELLYEQALLDLMTKYERHPEWTLVIQEFVDFYLHKKSYFSQEELSQLRLTALQWCNKASDKYPESSGAKWCIREVEKLKAKNIQFLSEKYGIPDQDWLAKITYQNCTEIYLSILTIQDKTLDNLLRQTENAWKDWINSQEPVHNWKQDLIEDGDLLEHSTEIKMPGLAAGTYLVVVKQLEHLDAGYQRAIVYKSKWSFITGSSQKRNWLAVVNRETGAPVPNADVQELESSYDSGSRKSTMNVVRTSKTDKDGFIWNLSSSGRMQVIISKDGDTLHDHQSIYFPYFPSQPNRDIIQTYFFCDRPVYRPGHRIFVKGLIVSKGNLQIPKVISGATTKLTLRDPNGEIVHEKELHSNEFGSIQSNFVIPSSRLSGTWRIESSRGGVHYFRVEEYKRQKFAVTINPPDQSYQLGKETIITGSAIGLTGAVINGALVKYRVFRGYRHPWHPHPYFRYPVIFDQTFLGEGQLLTGNDGSFNIPISLLPDAIIPPKFKPSFTFEIQVEVTDLNGESLEKNLFVTATYDPYQISMGSKAHYQEGKAVSVELSHVNQANKRVSGKGVWKLFSLQKPADYLRKRSWPAPDRQVLSKNQWQNFFPYDAYGQEDDWRQWSRGHMVSQGSYSTDSASSVSLEWPGLSIGAYCVEVLSGDSLKAQKYFYIWRPGVQLPVYENLQIFVAQDQYQPGDELILHFLSARLKNWVLLQIDQPENERVLWIPNVLDKQQQIFIKELDRGNFGLTANLVSQNLFNVQGMNIQVPWKNKELSVKLTTFRPAILPGSTESWEVQIGKDGSPVSHAEITSTLYDASLDFIETLQWPQRFYPTYYRIPALQNRAFGTINGFEVIPPSQRDNITFPGWFRLNWFGYFPGRRVRTLYRSVDAVEVSAPPSGEEMESQKSENLSQDGVIEEVLEEAIAEEVPLIPRQNLNETVFFLGNLRADKEGKVKFDFKMNEALTSWKWKIFAHTPDLATGSATETIITKKDLMVFPNFPRFVREGDVIELPVKVTNLQESEVQGEAWIELFDPDNADRELTFFIENQIIKYFELKSGQSINLSWPVKIPDHFTRRLGYRVWARSGKHQDGEENILPVLSKKVWITETMPIAIQPGQSKEWIFENYLEKWSHPGTWSERFTLEMTPNPVWMAIKSVPYMTSQIYETSENLATQYFALRLGRQLIIQNPIVKSQITSWITGDEQSQLSQNQELKIVNLEQTPWVAESQQEAENIRNLGLLLDENYVRNEMTAILDKLASRQNADGGFPWCAQGRSNFFVTLSVLDIFKKLTEYQLAEEIDIERIGRILENSLVYLDEQMLRKYQEILKGKHLDDYRPSGNELKYLLLKKHYKDQESDEIQKMITFYQDQLKKYWLELSLFIQANLGVLVFDKDPAFATMIMNSLLEKSLIHEELGRHWSKIGGSRWWQQPVITQTAIIRFLSAMQVPSGLVDECKIWLLKNKQTNHWENSLTTAEAILALLGEISQEIETQNTLSVRVGDQVINVGSGKDGSQYWKKSWDKSELTENLGKINVENAAKHIAWGAAYWQYFRDIDQIDDSGSSALSVERDLYKIGSNGKNVALQDIQQFVTGDRVRIRLTLKNDRDMEFVMLEDTRGSGFEPTSNKSEYVWQSGMGYYREIKDISTRFYISFLPKGTHVLEYEIYLAQYGKYSGGMAKAQNFYAPEFNSVAGSDTYNFYPVN